MVILVNKELASVLNDSCGHKDQQVARGINFGAAPEERAKQGQIAEDRHRLDKGGALPLQDATHGHGFTGLNHNAGAEFLGTVLRETDGEAGIRAAY